MKSSTPRGASVETKNVFFLAQFLYNSRLWTVFIFYLVTLVIGKFLSVIFLIVYLYSLHRGRFIENKKTHIGWPILLP